MYVCRVVGLRITGGKREEQDWPKGLEQLGTTWPDLDEVYLGGGRGGGEYYSGLTSINDADAQKTTTDTLNKSQSTPPEGLFVEADSL